MKFNLTSKRISEANIQAEVYHRLRLAGITCYLEYKYQNCRFDMVIVKGDEIILIVEFKSRIKQIGKINTKGKQYQKYTAFGVPVLYCTHQSEIEDTMRVIRKYHSYNV